MEQEIRNLRYELHKFPELSGEEVETTAMIHSLLKDCNPDLLQKGPGDKGLWAVFDSGNPGPAVMFRADIDALPIHETLSFSHASAKQNVSHKCGHDGHTAIMVGFASWVAEHRPHKGKLILLFQSAEETGMGAKAIVEDAGFQKLHPDYSFAMHNLPGYPAGSVVVRVGTFAAASRGMIIRLKGRTSHASEPEKGQSPASVIAQLMSNLPRLATNGNNELYEDFVLLTLIHANLGTPAFGTSPGEAVLMATLRAYRNEDMEIMCKLAEEMVARASEGAGLQCSVSYTEEFPATVNHKEPVDMVLEAARMSAMTLTNAVLPFRWSEDFAHFGKISKAVLFGIGAGEEQPPLHHPDYDFPDHIIPSAIKIWIGIYENLLGVASLKEGR
ncbi:MAG: amidohydrolase [Lentimicrobium sp.]|nr:amidohydrolase [Lentimicrobium sp.]